jgi:hypothetical protein
MQLSNQSKKAKEMMPAPFCTQGRAQHPAASL